MSFDFVQGFQSVLILFILVGFLFGLLRGFGKSVVRFFMLIAVAVICFFIAPPISRAIAGINIAKLGIKIGDVEVTTIKEAITTLVENFGPVGELNSASPTFAAFVNALPALVLNLIVFALTYIVLGLISILFSWLISRAIFKKRKKGEHQPLRIVGGLVGAIAGVMVFAILTVPFFGISDTLQQASKQLNAQTTTAQASQTTSQTQSNSNYTLVSETTGNGSTEDKKINTEKVDKVTDKFSSSVMYKVFRALGITKVQNKIFDSLTTTTINKEKVVLKHELMVVSKVANKFGSLTGLSTSSTDQDYADAEYVVSTLFDSSLFSRIAEESLRYAATEWLDETDPTAFGIKRPNLGDIADPVLESTLMELKSVTRKTLENDLIQVVELVKVTNKNGVLNALTKNSDSETIMNTLSAEGALSSIVDVMLKSTTLKAVLPDAIQAGINSIYPTIGVPKAADKEQKVFTELAQIVVDIKADRASGKYTTDADAMADLLILVEQNMSKNLYDFSNIETSAKSTWLATVSNQFYLLNILQEEIDNTNNLPVDQQPYQKIKAVLNANPITVNATTTRNYADVSNIGRVTQEQITVADQITDEQWQQEKLTFEKMFKGAVDALNSTKNVEEGKEFDNFNFGALGVVFDSLRHSYLLDDRNPDVSQRIAVEKRSSFSLVVAILQSDLMDGISVTESFINTLKDSWDDENFKFEDAFNTLGSTIKILNSFKSSTEGLKADDVKNLIEGLNGESGDVVKEILKDAILSSNNENSTVAEAIGDIVDRLGSQEAEKIANMNAEKEAKALNSTLDILEKTKDSSKLDSLTKEEVKETIDAIIDSDIVFDALVGTAGDSDALGIKDATNNSSAETNQAISDALNNQQTIVDAIADPAEKAAAQAKLDQLKNLFGK